MRSLTIKLPALMLVAVSLALAVPAGAVRVLPAPDMKINVRKHKVHITGAPIVDVYRRDNDSAEPKINLSAWMPNLAHRLQAKDKQGKVDIAKLANILKEDEKAERYFGDVRDYLEWLKRQEYLGSNMEVTGQFLKFPEGLYVVIRPGLQAYKKIVVGVLSVDGGGTWNPIVYIPGVGWGGPFSASQLEAMSGGKEVMAVIVDHSNSKQIEVWVISFGTKEGLGTQQVPYQFFVTQPEDANRKRLNIQTMPRDLLVKQYCQGIIPAWTEGLAVDPVVTKTNGETATSNKVDLDREVTGAKKDVKADGTVKIVDLNGEVLQRPIQVLAQSFDAAGKQLESMEVDVDGPTAILIAKGRYRVEIKEGQGDFEVIEQEVDANGFYFVFREKPKQSRMQDRNQQPKSKPKPRQKAGDSEFDDLEVSDREIKPLRRDDRNFRRDAGAAAQVVYTVYLSKKDQDAAREAGVLLRFSWFVTHQDKTKEERPVVFNGSEYAETRVPATSTVTTAFDSAFLKKHPSYASHWFGRLNTATNTFHLGFRR